MSDLKAMWQERAGAPDMKERDDNYKKYEDAYYKRTKNNAPGSYKPTLKLPGEEETPRLLNPSAQIVKHFAAMFSRLPRISNLPLDASPSSIAVANKMTSFLTTVANNSGMKALQPLQGHRLSLRGDAVYGVEWEDSTGKVYWRGFDPQFCYPSLNALDFGACNDILIMMEVSRGWANKAYGVNLDLNNKSKAKVFVYWDGEKKETQVEEHQRVGEGVHTFAHKLGFCPFRWVFAQPTGHFAQSDVQDVIEMSEVMNEAIVLAIDALRFNVYRSYWGTGIRENAVPKPGEIIAFNSPEAQVHAFETSPPPDMAMNLLEQMKREVQAGGGISPVSAEGMVGGSIVTGTAVRHQVEAIEARAETKRVELEAMWSKLAEYTLKVLERQFPDAPITYRKSRDEFDTVTGEEVKGWYECEADYGIVGMDRTARARLAMEGLGRIWDDYGAVRLADPDSNPGEAVERLQRYQVRMAEMTAKAQVAAQRVAQEGHQEQPGAGMQPPPMMGNGQPVPSSQMPGRPQPPAPSQMMQSIHGIQEALMMIGETLHGSVWAVGEIAVTGMAAQPIILVENRKDLGNVHSSLQHYNAIVAVGKPEDDDMPRTKVA